MSQYSISNIETSKIVDYYHYKSYILLIIVWTIPLYAWQYNNFVDTSLAAHVIFLFHCKLQDHCVCDLLLIHSTPFAGHGYIKYSCLKLLEWFSSFPHWTLVDIISCSLAEEAPAALEEYAG